MIINIKNDNQNWLFRGKTNLFIMRMIAPRRNLVVMPVFPAKLETANQNNSNNLCQNHETFRRKLNRILDPVMQPYGTKPIFEKLI